MLRKLFQRFFSLVLLGLLLISTGVGASNLTNNTKSDPTQFSKQVVDALYNYNYQNYQKKLNEASDYFTNLGWRKYKKGLDASNNVQAVKKMKMTVTEKIVGPIKIIPAKDTLTSIVPVEITYHTTRTVNKKLFKINIKMIRELGSLKITDIKFQ